MMLNQIFTKLTARNKYHLSAIDIGVPILTSAFMLITSSVTPIKNPILIFIPAVLLFLVALSQHRKNLFQLKTRSLSYDDKAKSVPKSWCVYVNDVSVGYILDTEYSAIKHREYTRVANFIAQAMNIGSMIFNVFSSLLRAIPICFFWLVVAFSLIAPSEFASLLDAIQDATRQDIISAIHSIIYLIVLSIMIAVMSLVALHLSAFGYQNKFSQAVAKELRFKMKVPAEGTLALVPVQHIEK